jgi:hypothetical protein
MPETITFQINEDYTVEIQKFIGSNGEYYSVNGINYDIHFPIEWVFQTPIITYPEENDCFGPEECNVCAEYGYYNGVFIGYCLYCANKADFKRGNGMMSVGVEIDNLSAKLNNIPIEYKDKESMWNVYMQAVSFEEIGDETLHHKHQSFFSLKKNNDTQVIERVFDYYGWLNSNHSLDIYTSDAESKSIE